MYPRNQVLFNKQKLPYFTGCPCQLYYVSFANLTLYKDLSFLLQLSEYGEEALEIASIFDSTNFTEDTRRQLKEVGVQPLPEDEERELSNIISEMGKVYGSTKVCIEG